ncbi:uncharacterized protein LOC142597332 [Dermatophagoides farinae]|uniref:uncharacterized protein LOC142597332 n=1 Tax=Dermatophagoides farinae TaxID=6954 RepID=UPI003F61B149
MSKRKISTTNFLCLITLAMIIKPSQGYCCHRVRIYNCSGTDELQTLCPDCTEPTPWCGVTECNLIGCNCFGCREQKQYTRIDNLAITDNDDPINHFQ